MEKFPEADQLIQPLDTGTNNSYLVHWGEPTTGDPTTNAIPPVTLTTMWHGSGGQPMQWESVVALDRGELLKWSGWSGASNSPLDRRRAATSMISGDLQWTSSHPYDEGGKER